MCWRSGVICDVTGGPRRKELLPPTLPILPNPPLNTGRAPLYNAAEEAKAEADEAPPAPAPPAAIPPADDDDEEEEERYALRPAASPAGSPAMRKRSTLRPSAAARNEKSICRQRDRVEE